MRPSLRRGLVALLILPLAAAAYTLYWNIAATRLAQSLRVWALKERAQGIDVSWQRLSVTGYPLSFRVTVEDARISGDAITPRPQLTLPSLSGSAWPWSLAEWRLSAPAGLAFALLDGAAPKLWAERAGGALTLPREGGAKMLLQLEKARAAGFAADRADLGLTLPREAPRKDTDNAFSLSVHLEGIRMPFALAPLGSRIADLFLAMTLKGPVESGPLERVAAAWRDAGGTIVLDRLRLRWGPLDTNASGTLALDPQMQPMGAFSATIEGYDDIVAALVASGWMRREAGGLARIALRLLSRPGPDGRPEIATSLTIQNGKIYLGPAMLGPSPRLAWH